MWHGGLIPPGYGEALYRVSGSTGGDIVRGTASTAASAAPAILSAAGVTALAPVPGARIAAGVIAGVAGIAALVSGIARGSVRKAEAVRVAQELGLPDPEMVPAFVVRALKWNSAKTKRKLSTLKRRRQRRARFGFSTHRTDAKIAILKAVLAEQRARRAGTVPVALATAPVATPAAAFPVGPVVLGGAALIAVVLLVQSRSNN